MTPMENWSSAQKAVSGCKVLIRVPVAVTPPVFSVVVSPSSPELDDDPLVNRVPELTKLEESPERSTLRKLI